METTIETIKDVSVQIVKDFIDNKVPLSEGIAKYASEMELGPEQIKRVVETCNTVTYLTLQKEATDRTFEFPVADYNSVMASLVMPAKQDGTVTEANFKEEQEKQATNVNTYEPEHQAVQAWATKEYIRNKAMLEKLSYDKEACVQNIGDLCKVFKKDEWALEKLAEVTDTGTFAKLSHLIRDIPGKIQLRSRIFKEAELSQARDLIDLYKEGQRLITESEYREGLEKRAILQALAGGLGKAIGGAIGIGTGAIAKGLAVGARSFGKQKFVGKLDVAATAITEPKPTSNVWDNLQGRQKRF